MTDSMATINATYGFQYADLFKENPERFWNNVNRSEALRYCLLECYKAVVHIEVPPIETLEPAQKEALWREAYTLCDLPKTKENVLLFCRMKYAINHLI